MAWKLTKMLALLAAAAGAAYADGGVNGETGPDNSSTPTTTAGEITIHHITVGRSMNAFTPNSIQAKPGDIVEFTFYPSNHSVIRSAYGYPCVPYESVHSQSQGFTSGPMAVNDSGVYPTWNLTINNTEPVFFYCGAPGSCFGWGMLGVINANNATDLSKQISIARSESWESWPGDQIPAAVLASLASVAATGTAVVSSSSTLSATVTSTTAASTSTAAAEAAASSSNSLSGGAIAGIVIGAFAVLLGAAALFFLLGRTHRNKREHAAQQQQLLAQGQPAHPMSTYGGPEHGYAGSPGLPNAQLPPYIAASEAKGPYDSHVSYLGPQEPMRSPPATLIEHPSYSDFRSATSSPPPAAGSTRHSATSELEGAAVHAVRASPNLGSVQELDGTHRPGELRP